MNTFTSKDKYLAASREVAMRRSVYPGLVTRGRMTNDEAERGIAIMSQIAEDYRKLADQEEPDLFTSQRSRS